MIFFSYLFLTWKETTYKSGDVRAGVLTRTGHCISDCLVFFLLFFFYTWSLEYIMQPWNWIAFPFELATWSDIGLLLNSFTRWIDSIHICTVQSNRKYKNMGVRRESYSVIGGWGCNITETLFQKYPANEVTQKLSYVLWRHFVSMTIFKFINVHSVTGGPK